MGFLDALSGLMGENETPHETAAGLAANALESAGGIQGLLGRADEAGLGEHVRSWIGDGSNWPVSPEQIESVFPPEELDRFAQQHGLPAGAVSSVLAEVLPHAVDHATPNGDAATADTAPGGFDLAGLAARFLR